jgi:hypothetical protein
LLLVPPSHYNPRAQRILVFITQLFKHARGRRDGGFFAIDGGIDLGVLVHDISDGLGVGGGAGAAAVDAVVDVGELVGDSVSLLG